MEQSSNIHEAKRKHISTAFCKESLNFILRDIICSTLKNVRLLVQTQKNKKSFSLTKWVQNLMMENIEISVFGVTN